MRRYTYGYALVLGAAFGLASTARADFVGQPLLGPLTNGSVATGSTAGAADDNDGFDSGVHIFNIWDGGDDVYVVNWAGGNMTVNLTSFGPGVDNDLFVYSPGALDSTGDYSILGANDSVTLLGAAAGTYYINIDTTAFSEGGYRLEVIPAPAGIGSLGMGVAALTLRRRR
ncbi:MAG: hypothetical protein JSR77_11540 [Planctomycetes bacterium]|nr:hypothetical protein [Planctomycetota bacterium]